MAAGDPHHLPLQHLSEVAGGHLFVGPDNGLLMPALTRILDHVGIKSIAPSFKSARGPPQQHWCEDNWD